MRKKAGRQFLALAMSVVMAYGSVPAGAEAITEGDFFCLEETLDRADELPGVEIVGEEAWPALEVSGEGQTEPDETQLFGDESIDSADLYGTVQIDDETVMNVLVRLYAEDAVSASDTDNSGGDSAAAPESETRTDAEGAYRFEDLQIGTYRVEYIHPEADFSSDGYELEAVQDLAALTDGEAFAAAEHLIVTEDTQLDLHLISIGEDPDIAAADEGAQQPEEQPDTMQTMEEQTGWPETAMQIQKESAGTLDAAEADDKAAAGATEETEESLDAVEAVEEETVSETDSEEQWDEMVFAQEMASGASLLLGAAAGNWGFDVYYVNETDLHHVEKASDFSLKYQMEFHTSETLPAGAVIITIPAKLMDGRSGSAREEILPDDVGLPKADLTGIDTTRSDREIVAQLIDAGQYKRNGRSSFNYYYNEEGDLVFFNFMELISGTNATWQVLYKRLYLINIEDGTTWSLEASALVLPQDGAQEEVQSAQALTGVIDSHVTLQSVEKEALDVTTLNYTPGLYTAAQVDRYVDWYTSTTWKNRVEKKQSAFDNYRYVVWNIRVKGSGNQHWNLYVQDTPSYQAGGSSTERYGAVVGFGQGNVTGAYNVRISEPENASVDGLSGSACRIAVDHGEETWGTQFYVVTAYPVSYVEDGSLVKNTVNIALEPSDGLDDVQTASDSAQWSYADYNWSYRGSIIGIDKWNKDMADSSEEHQKTYPGWLEKYEASREEGKDAGGLPFTSWGRCYGYVYTHYTDTSQPSVFGEYREGSYYRITFTDDAVYAYADGQEILLGSEDYYFDSVTFKRTDWGYDFWEDTTAQALSPEGIDQTMTVYAMFAGSQDWEAVGTVDFNGSQSTVFTFDQAAIARQPYRVKAVYQAVGATHCYADVSVCLRQDSPKLSALLYDAEGDRSQVKSLQIENLSGIAGQIYGVPGYTDGTYFQDTSTSGGNGFGDSNYSEPGLSEFTQSLYDTILMRDCAFKTLTDLDEEAAAFKTVSLENDPENNRVLATYCLTAYTGYKVYGSELLPYLRQLGVDGPQIREFVWYDLLPLGVELDAAGTITAGRITSMDSNGYYRSEPGYWDQTQVRVSVSASDIVHDWRGSGRTMVAFHLTYEGSDPAVFMNSLWAEGFGLSFQGYYSWDELSAADTSENTNIAAFMPDGESAAQRLYGRGTEVYLDDGTVPADGGYEWFSLGDLNEDGVSDIRNVLYAWAWTSEDVAVSAQDKIEKSVRADSELSAPFSVSTSVVPEGTYTYHITVTSASGMKDLVVFDRLERAGEDRSDIPNETIEMEDAWWQGTFLSVDLSEAQLLGIDPVVYYNAQEQAQLPQANTALDEGDVDTVLSSGGWVMEEDWGEAGYSMSDVRAVAVDLRKMSDGSSFTLASGEAVSFNIRMQAPAQAEAVWAYNNPSFFSTRLNSTGEALSTAFVVGNSVRVSLGQTGVFEVEKSFANEEEVPLQRKNETFTFTITRLGAVYANQIYELQTLSGEAVDNKLHATDYQGRLELKAGQKAVFRDIAVNTLEDFTVEEQESIFWETTVSEHESDGVFTMTFTNRFRSAVYLQKKTAGIPDDLTDTGAVQEAVFTFRLTDGFGEPVSNAQFWYVTSARTDGMSPEKNTSRGKQGIGTTDEEGLFTLQAGDIAALFPGAIGDMYVVSELTADGCIANDGLGDNWIVTAPEVSGMLSASAQPVTVTNYYRWKDLALTKSITHRDTEDALADDTSFTFRITDSSGRAAAGKQWELDEGTESLTGVTDEEGIFSAPMAGRTVIIHGLEAEETYTIEELNCPENYEMVNQGSVTVKMPLYASKKAVTITNDWLSRPLKVSKIVASGDDFEEADSTWFTFEIHIDGELYAGQPFTVEKNGRQVIEDGRAYETDENGQFCLKNGESAVFKDAGVNLVTTYEVREIHKEGERYAQIYPIDNGSSSGIISGEDTAAVFINGDEGILLFGKSVAAGEGENPVSQALITAGEIPSVRLLLEYLDDWTDEAEPSWKIFSGQMFAAFSVRIVDPDGTVREISETEKAAMISEGSLEAETGAMFMISGSWTDESGTQHSISSMQLRISEMPEYRDQILYYEGEDLDAETLSGYVRMQVQTPVSGTVTIRDLAQKPTAIITNVLTDLDEKSVVHKSVLGLSEPSEGDVLRFIVERYTGSGWVAETGLNYYLRTPSHGHSSMQQSDADGTVALTLIDGKVPEIVFPDSSVVINPSQIQPGTLRIRESSSRDSSWGELTGYAIGEGETSLALQDADTFVNDTRKADIRVEKVLKGSGSQTQFAFLLEQVVRLDEDKMLEDLVLSDILETQMLTDISYQVYSSDDDSYLRSEMVSTEGILYLAGGEYALLSVGHNTLWKISEQSVPSGYRLESAEAGGSMASAVAPNAVLVKAQGEPIVTMCYQDDEGTTARAQLRDLSELPTEVNAGRSGYLFSGWYMEPSCETPASGQITEDLTVYGGWTERDAVLDKSKINKDADHMIFARTSDYPQIAAQYEGISANVKDTGKVTRYDVTDEESGEITSYYLSSTVTYLQENLFRAFAVSNVKTIDFRNIDASRSNYMLAMFAYDDKLVSINFNGSFDTSSVYSMAQMFYKCSSLETLELPENFDTSAVTNMHSMFYECSSLTQLTLPASFDTSLVTDMHYMFYYCSALRTLTLPEAFDTSLVSDMHHMFYYCSSLTGLRLPDAFDTSRVTNMRYMFAGMRVLAALELPGAFDTTNVTDFQRIFYNDQYLQTTFTLRTASAGSAETIDVANALYYASITEGSYFTLNYTAQSEALAQRILSTAASSGNHVSLGEQVE